MYRLERPLVDLLVFVTLDDGCAPIENVECIVVCYSYVFQW